MKEFEKSLASMSEHISKTATNAVTTIDNDNETRDEILRKLRENLEKFCHQIDKLQNMNNITEQMLAIDETSDKEVLLQKWNDNLSIMEPDTSDNKYLKEYDERISALIKNTVQSQSNDLDSDDLSLQKTQSINLICPISKCKMTVPMKNPKCGHVYDKNSVASLILNNPRSKCPMLGCDNEEPLSMDNLQTDFVTQLHLESSSVL